jgi:hypothetical protein
MISTFLLTELIVSDSHRENYSVNSVSSVAKNTYCIEKQ